MKFKTALTISIIAAISPLLSAVIMLSVEPEFIEAIFGGYGYERGSKARFAEAFEVCEYGSPLTDELKEELFPF